MANGDQWEIINEIRRDVSEMKANGCAHKNTQDRDVRDLKVDLRELKDEAATTKKDIWTTIDREREAREGMIKQIVIGVLIIVCGGVILNMVALSWMLPKVMAAVR